MKNVIESFSHLLVVDLEATCDDRASKKPLVPVHEMETIEVGAVLVDRGSLAPVAEFQSFVRPARHPVLTPFCMGLTTIRQEDVDRAPPFPAVMEALAEFLGAHAPRGAVLFASWGAYDKNQLARDAAHHRVALPLGREHLNLKQSFAERFGERKVGMNGALARVGLSPTGTHHRGIDDARNIARLLPWIVGDAAVSGRHGEGGGALRRA